MLTATLPAKLTPADIISKDVNDVRLLSKALLKRRKFRIDFNVFCRPDFRIALGMS
jgi:hypothetical protein